MSESTSSRWRGLGILMALAWAILAAPTIARAVPAIYNLMTVGGPASFGHGVNASGQVAGYFHNTSSQQHAFLYTGTPGSGGALMDLGTLYGYSSSSSYANDINASGQIVGRG